MLSCMAFTSYGESEKEGSSYKQISAETEMELMERFVLASIEQELASCDQFKISVAFITKSGVTPLLQVLKELEEKEIQGEIAQDIKTLPVFINYDKAEGEPVPIHMKLRMMMPLKFYIDQTFLYEVTFMIIQSETDKGDKIT